MPTVRFRGVIGHPRDVVFAFVADAENNPRWHEHVRETRWLDDGPTRVGRRGLQLSRLWFRDWRFVAEVVEFEPPTLITFQVIEGYRVRTSIRTEPSGDGSTVLTLDVASPRILGRRVDALVSALMKRSVRGRERGDMTRLRRALDEAAAAAPPRA